MKLITDGGPDLGHDRETQVTQRVRVVIADGDPLARRVVRDALQRQPDIVVVADARDGVEAEELTCHYRPDVLLMETALPRMDGIASMQQILERTPEARVVLFSIAPDDDLALRALRAGAAGFLTKDIDQVALARALRGVARGEAAISRRIAMRLVEVLRAAPSDYGGLRPVRSVLTAREWEVLDLLIGGASTDEAAMALVLTPDTVYSHIKSIMRKFGVRSRADAIAAGRALQRASAAA